MDGTIAAIRSILAPAMPPPSASVQTGTSPKRVIAPELATAPSGVKDAKTKMLKLLKNQPQPDLRAIAGRLGLTERAAKKHLQILFRAGLIKKTSKFYELTLAGKAWLGFEDKLAAHTLILRARTSLYKAISRSVEPRRVVCPLCQQPIVREAA
jgi:predicted transcriptional regulator